MPLLRHSPRARRGSVRHTTGQPEMALLSWDGLVINALVQDWPKDVEDIFKDDAARIDQQVRGGCQRTGRGPAKGAPIL